MSDEHNTAARRLRFGTVGWRHEAWVQGYYPEGLPEDWQLGYYANELAAVLLPATAWVGESPQQLARWAEDVHPAFRFYLLADAGREPSRQAVLAAELEGCLGGVLWPVPGAPAGMLGPSAQAPARTRAWGDASGVRVAVLQVTGLDLRGRRRLLEQLLPLLSTHGDKAIFLGDADTMPGEARELQTVAELMGLA
jgi:hypothetical protein